MSAYCGRCAVKINECKGWKLWNTASAYDVTIIANEHAVCRRRVLLCALLNIKYSYESNTNNRIKSISWTEKCYTPLGAGLPLWHLWIWVPQCGATLRNDRSLAKPFQKPIMQMVWLQSLNYSIRWSFLILFSEEYTTSRILGIYSILKALALIHCTLYIHYKP